MTTNIQVVGFSDTDSYQDVLEKAAKGLGINSWCRLSLPETEICGKKWSLGEYIRYNGGTVNCSKKVWGVLVEEEDSDPYATFDPVRNVTFSVGQFLIIEALKYFI